jgi:hypothetical protein
MEQQKQHTYDALAVFDAAVSAEQTAREAADIQTKAAAAQICLLHDPLAAAVKKMVEERQILLLTDYGGKASLQYPLFLPPGERGKQGEIRINLGYRISERTIMAATEMTSTGPRTTVYVRNYRDYEKSQPPRTFDNWPQAFEEILKLLRPHIVSAGPWPEKKKE